MANSPSNKKHYKVGDKVLIRAVRYADGSGCSVPSEHCADYASTPVVECVISQVEVCGLPEMYALTWADTGEHVGLPFWEENFIRRQ